MRSAGDTKEVAVGVPCLVVMYGKELGKRHSLDTLEQILGRSDTANIQIDQDSVSRQHAKIITEFGSSRLFDLGSTNGTFVNDKRTNEVELRDGDLVRIGQTIFKYLSGSNIENKYHEEIYSLTTIDGLTGAYNKRFFLEALSRELNRAVRYDRVLSLAMFDLDLFKKINDNFGHLGGDFVLRELAGVVHQNIRRDDIFARYGGEEFALILPEVDLQAAISVSEKLRQGIEQHRFDYNDQIIPVTISLGLRTFSRGEQDINVSQFIADADAKLYSAKASGRNKVCA
ncbi:MAG: diguanylate cyclase [Deltaproteobacteria bacterium]|nr:diguanylate cyclase [Deltaproteobacteria bacterium]